MLIFNILLNIIKTIEFKSIIYWSSHYHYYFNITINNLRWFYERQNKYQVKKNCEIFCKYYKISFLDFLDLDLDRLHHNHWTLTTGH